ncbi:glycoside hydrolase family 15 protein [Rufibacter psychrotolerans]|uniref:glycoside hydrolase family 15 protein n=1 Tax=Rufibacter psychrotolerans TaxID=2812556 RepID=UPI001967538F|nr:glycoside hydrolase family 15 protein [Rufibacter sp. SYSU D00308]
MPHYLPIEKYGLIGNLHTTALVSKYGSLDYLPFPRFDAPTVFARLLDHKKGGFWSIKPATSQFRSRQQYIPDTAILHTRFYTQDGMAELTDFMPLKGQEESGVVVRMLKVVKGQMSFRMELAPCFNYARSPHTVTRKGPHTFLLQSQGPDGTLLQFSTDQPCTVRRNTIRGTWTLHKHETVCFVLAGQSTAAGEPIPNLRTYFEGCLRRTYRYWHAWVAKSSYQGYWREMVMRSAITLKLLTSSTYGSTVAAATFSLPEDIGGPRNWDYRFTWIRDAAFTIYAFLRLGYMEEARQFCLWVMDRCREMPSAAHLQLMYAVDGSTDLHETTLDHLEGYHQTGPVRIGNQATEQFQLDIYGELIDTIYLYNKYGGPITYSFWKDLCALIDFVAENWQRPDHGIWEVRSERQEFTYSKIMAWVALDRGVRIAQDRSFPAPLERWISVRNAIFEEVYEKHWNEEKQAFVQFKGASTLDAAVLLMPLVRMISPVDPKWLSTLKAIEEDLMAGAMVYRYNLQQGAEDGLTGDEGTFSMCSFWYAENLSKAGQHDKARLQFETMLGYANHLGLYSEQIGKQGEQLGNFPQAFTHLALISAAYQLNRQLNGEDHKKGNRDLYI